ncbi:hypothetical protein MOX02_50920 [Methylobacterium oxalidis]|uniref:Uncharacterized protein n=1 Tax=Methylobacterium oxalidis TaxID=944322 RepID=A0A512JAQ9_9HYPH|nr:hypothetical protein MOX02_50920 [Methylobacterium oxalidis]GLS67606.1 hypothetical protein GCM10007888_59900 [Methylobacterium oxalidis]
MPSLLPIDHWTARSLLQKAIRRGDAEDAARAAVTLFALRGSAIWRRFMVIAFEDVGAGSAEAVIQTVELCLAPGPREQLGGDGPAAAWLARFLAGVPKDRGADFLICAAKDHPSLEAARQQSGSCSVSDRLAMVLNLDLPLAVGATAAWFASGLNQPGECRLGRGNLRGLMDAFLQLGIPAALVHATQLAARRTREPITLMVPLIWRAAFEGEYPHTVEEPVPTAMLVDEVPLYAFDKHTRIGKQAIGRLARENEALRACLEEHVPEYRHRDAACMAAFYADAAPVARRLGWQGSAPAERLGTESDMLRAGVPVGAIEPLLAAVRANLGHLNAIRAEIFRRTMGRG